MITESKIAFFYPSYYPVSGGSSVHGYHLAKNLTALGYRLTTFANNADGFTNHKKKSPFLILAAIIRSDIVYVRIGTGGLSRYIPRIAKFLGKKVIAEINGPADEIVATKSASKEDVNKADESLSEILRKVDAVITVSELMGSYCKTTLNHKNVFVIENGGERFDGQRLIVSEEFRHRIEVTRSKYKKIAVWSGTHYPWQGFEKIRQLISITPVEVGFFLISNDKSVWKSVESFPNVFCFEKLSRDEAGWLILQSDTGLAVYGDFNWSRFKEFHGSSLKYFEYLANGLCVIASPSGHMKNSSDADICVTNDLNIMKLFLMSCRKSSRESYRSWKEVAEETSLVIQSLL